MVRFGELLRQEMQSKFREIPVARIFGDPAGDYRAQTDESTPFQILRGAGIRAIPAPSNDVSLCIESVSAPLSRLLEGKSGLLIDKSCKHLIKGLRVGISIDVCKYLVKDIPINQIKIIILTCMMRYNI